jgi:hypothetical protein
MASETSPPYSRTDDQQPIEKSIEDIPPTYNDATGILDIRQNGLSAQTQVRG